MDMLLNNADTISLFFIALSAAFSHCYAMCGGIVLAFSQQLDGSFFRRFFAHLLYNLGRITTYTLIGIICVYLGMRLSVSDSARGGIFIILGFFMFIFGIGYLCLPKIIYLFEPNIGNLSIFKRALSAVIKHKGFVKMYLLGLLNGMLPCGIVYFFAMNAAVSGSYYNAIKIMLIFGVATMIPILILGVFSAILAITRFKEIFMKFSALLIILFGIYTIFKGFSILFA